MLDFFKLLNSLLIFEWAFEDFKQQSLNSYQFSFLGWRYPVSTGSFPMTISCSLTKQNLFNTITEGLSGFLLVECVALSGLQWWQEKI
jgi:hypothetical protein